MTSRKASPNARAIARDVLVRVEDGAYSNVLLPSKLRASTLSPRDRAFATNLVYGTLRSLRRVDDLLDRYGRRPVTELDPQVRAALRLGAMQLLEGTAPHAAVSESVDLVPARARGYVNAVLRAIATAGPRWPTSDVAAVALSYPDWVVARLENDLGHDDAHAALEAQNIAGSVTLRPNRNRTDTDNLAAELESHDIVVERGTLVPDALIVRGVGDLAALPAVSEGRATPQDQGSQAVIDVLAPVPGDRVLDIAAAPGGKTTAIAERVGAGGLVVALDVDAGRLRLVREAAQRLGVRRVVTVQADARQLPIAPTNPDRPNLDRTGFDRVLVDAPCTGLGVLRRRPEARWRVEESAVDRLADLQVELVVAAAGAVAVGGILVYSVCTLTTTETVGVAERVMATLGSAFETLPPPPEPWRPWGAGGLLLPQAAGTDGMFTLALRRE